VYFESVSILLQIETFGQFIRIYVVVFLSLFTKLPQIWSLQVPGGRIMSSEFQLLQ